MPTPEVSCTAVVNCHDEGRLAWRAFRSAWEALARLPDGELLLVLDAPDRATRACARDFARAHEGDAGHRVRSLTVDHRDLGLARNAACAAAHGRYVAFLDADDLWGPSWLERALTYLEGLPAASVAHQQINVSFGDELRWWEHVDSRSARFDPSVFMITNHWSALACAHRSVFAAHPYRASGGGFGFEDWEFNTRTLGAGIPHVVVPETSCFIRRSRASLSLRQVAAASAIRPNAFFDRPFSSPSGVGDPAELSIGPWLGEEWGAANALEPALGPYPGTLASRPRYAQPGAPALYRAYHRLRADVPPGVSDVLFIAGGGEGERKAREYADRLADRGSALLFVATEDEPAGPTAARACRAAAALRELPGPDRARVLQRLMLQLNESATLHVLDSRAARDAVALNPRILTAPTNPIRQVEI